VPGLIWEIEMPNATAAGMEFLQPPITNLSVIIPCKNEEKGIGLTIANIHEALQGLDLEYEIIIVDDGSADRTREVALAAGARVLVHNINLGYGNSIMDGMLIAKYPIVAILDGDGTYPASLLPMMIEKAASHDMVIGARAWTKHNTSLLGMLMRQSLYYVILYFSNKRAPDYNSGMRVFHKLDTLNYKPILCPTFSFTTTLTLLYLLLARSVAFVDIPYAKRIGTSKVNYVRDAVRTFSYVFLITSLFQPYRLAILMIGLGVTSNFLILLAQWFFHWGPALQFGLHITASLAVLVSAIAANTYPAAHLFLSHLSDREAK
jgi:polyisoprenyl-phosphate glycosyltransferase